MTSAGISAQPVTLETRDGIAVISINRPEARNAINQSVAHALSEALDQLDIREDLAVGVLTGAGGVFSAGMDLKAALVGESPSISGRGFGGLTRAAVRKPLIAAVEGWALGGGFELALACDLIVSGADARFGCPEVKRGLIASEGGLIRLPRRLPYHIAMQLLLTGDPIAAIDAARYGLVNDVTTPGDALNTALELADRIRVNAPLALAATKQVVHAAEGTDETSAFTRNDAAVAALTGTYDVREGAAAFTEKRPPRWRGR